jgi:hypothetical protein
VNDLDPPPPRLFDRIKQPAALNYVVTAVVGLVIYFLVMSSRGSDIIAIVAILFAILGVLARWGSAPGFVLILTTYGLYDPSFIGLSNMLSGGRFRPYSNAVSFNLEDLFLAAGLLAYFIGHFRLQSLIQQSMPNEPGPRRTAKISDPPRRPVATVASDELPRVLFIGAAAVVVGQLAWILLVIIERDERPHLYRAGMMRVFYFTFGIGLTLMLLSAVLTYLRMSSRPRREAEMYLRDTSLIGNLRETDRIFRWRKWYLDRKDRRKTRYRGAREK